jgi:hypothetical protein
VDEVVKEFIEHHGVVGMHWGVRRSVSKTTGKLATSADYRKVAALKKKPTRQLTNHQLRTANERMKLEQNFSRMNPGSVKKGAEAAAGILATIGVAATAYNMVKSPAGQAAVALGKRVLSKIKHDYMEVGVDFIKHRDSLLLRTVS